jgi:hypothetical protein
MQAKSFQPPQPGKQTFFCNTHSGWIVRMRW